MVNNSQGEYHLENLQSGRGRAPAIFGLVDTMGLQFRGNNRALAGPLPDSELLMEPDHLIVGF